MVLGQGSNVLFVNDFAGNVFVNKLKGKTILAENENEVLLKVASGENWHRLVRFCVQKKWGGIENLALIPGTAGAAPVQNIGAYGTEVADVLEFVEAVDIASGEKIIWQKKDLGLGYRQSNFKTIWKNRYFITAIGIKLYKNAEIQPNYPMVRETMEKMFPQQKHDLTHVFEAVCAIRSAKLPDVKKWGNAGSFFKNPVISLADAHTLQANFPQMPHFSVENGVKIPAAWLIEQCGWKNKATDKVGVYPNQALIIVNKGGATGAEIWDFAQQIIASVQENFGVGLEPEVQIVF